MDPDNIVFQVATWLIPLVFAIVLHEISHGWVASAFGDPTARERGRLSLNPLRHVDPVGTIVAAARPGGQRRAGVRLGEAGAGGRAADAQAAAPHDIGGAGRAGDEPAARRAGRLRPRRCCLWAAPGRRGLAGCSSTSTSPTSSSSTSSSPCSTCCRSRPSTAAMSSRACCRGGWRRRYAKLGRFGFPLLIVLLVLLPLLFPRANIVGQGGRARRWSGSLACWPRIAGIG